ncbi:probable serine/threonine-protein kinase PBL19 [Prunus avium]|uniref:non-specific serine/threonine protein kinase n=1 Tax=Prunus avium TaxID=42229 RepID=A0A6P5TKC9_PRUAV|nr:probable serine/threonine-protein kinase PBL19 [Prunus avium]XP_021827457.1 probable serine/threonine-protein kinase PBL19 [Prunus avium]
MKCFSFYIGEKKDEPKSTNTTFTDGEMKRSGSELDSQNISDASTESMRRNQYPSFSQRPSNLRIFTVSELKSATKNFSRSVMVGEGGFGCVYKGVIKSAEDPSQKLEVAVKQLSKRGLQGHKEWVTEVNVLGVVEHPNLVKLVGYCAEDDERGIQRLLIYEYMPNGSVENHLSSRSDPLPWPMRLKIAQDAARGLAYLHEEMDFQIIFRDFKSSNILLDEQWNAKLSDFGMARLGPSEGLTHVSTAVVGTMGYAAPEYIQTGRLTAKNDVWSYGVFLYELITGRRPLDRNRPKSEQKLLEWVKPYLSDLKKFRLIIDPRLEAKYPLKSVQKLAIVANRCLVRLPKNRPKMSEVLEMVNQIIEAPPSGLKKIRDVSSGQKKIREVSSNQKKNMEAPTGTASPQLPLKNLAPIQTSRDVETVNKRRNADLRRGETGWLSRVWTPKLLRTC